MMGRGKETCSLKIQDAQGLMMNVPLVVNWNLKNNIESLPFPSSTIIQFWVFYYYILYPLYQSSIKKRDSSSFPIRKGFNVQSHWNDLFYYRAGSELLLWAEAALDAGGTLMNKIDKDPVFNNLMLIKEHKTVIKWTNFIEVYFTYHKICQF